MDHQYSADATEGDAPSRAREWEFRLHVPEEWTEVATAALLGAGCHGIVENLPLAREGRHLVRAYVDSESERVRERALEFVRKALNASAIPELEDLAIQVQPVQRGGWEEAWKARWRPFRVGRFVIRPLDHALPPLRANDRELRIEPGGAFGTGLHPTTRMCLLLLGEFDVDRSLAHRPTFLDVGAGTGILALAADALGFQPLAAIEVNPRSIGAGAENLRRGGSRVPLLCGTLDACTARADLILANIVTDTLVELAEAFAAHSNPTATWICSGIARDRAERVIDAFARVGAHLVARKDRGKWMAGRWRFTHTES